MSHRTKEDRARVEAEAQALKNINVSDIDAMIDFAKNIVEKFPFTYFSILKGMKFKKIWDIILENTSFLNDIEEYTPNAATRIYYFINGLKEIHCCSSCGNEIKRNIKATEDSTQNFHCCNQCAQKDPTIIAKGKATKLERHGDPNYNNMEKNKKTCIERYGVEYSWQSEKTKESIKNTMLERHGVDHPMHSDEIKIAMQDRYEEKHGVRFSFQDPNVKQKIVETNRKNLNADYPMQNKDLKKIMISNSAIGHKRKYYENGILNFESVIPLFTVNEYIDAPRYEEFKWKCKKCGNMFYQRLWKYGNEPRCLKCDPLLYSNAYSQEELDLFNYMSSIEESHYECIRESYWNWNLLNNGKQLDIVCLDKTSKEPKLAVEFNGAYWHSIKNTLLGYHLMKTTICESYGVKLIHVFEDEWVNKKDETKLFLKKMLCDEEVLDLSKDIIELDRAKTNKVCIPEGYELVEEIVPSIDKHMFDNETAYMIENCGKLICKKAIRQ